MEGAGHREEAQRVPGSPRPRSGAEAALRPQPLHRLNTPTLGSGKHTVTPARSQLLSRESCSVSRHFLLLVLAPLLSLAVSQTQGRPWVLMT